MAFLLLLPSLLFMTMQGAVIFMTAYWGLRFFKISHWLGKTAAMALSYTAWIVVTLSGYILLGGDMGMMEGFGFVLILCFTAMVSTFVGWLLWILHSPRIEPREQFLIEPWP